MKLLTFEDFQPHLNSTFHARIVDGEVPFQLVEVRPLSVAAHMPGFRQPFSLLFHSEAAILLPQQIYTMEHAAMEPCGVFLVPVARDQRGFVYQAIFN